MTYLLLGIIIGALAYHALLLAGAIFARQDKTVQRLILSHLPKETGSVYIPDDLTETARGIIEANREQGEDTNLEDLP